MAPDSINTSKTHSRDTISDLLTRRADEAVILTGRYKIIRKLGEGGMGSVWLAEDAKLDGRKVAIKMLPVVLATNKRAIGQLKAEAKLAMQLSHPNIVTLRSFDDSEEGAFLVMDYVQGKTLEDILADKGTLSEDAVLKIFRPIAEALDYAHRQKVIHRDIKPSNILIREDGEPFIMDFGIAREMKDTMTRVTGRNSSGTLPYMSPEQLRGEAPAPAQDIYSLAATMYECLSGHPPFHRGDIAHQVEHAEPDSLTSRSALARSVMQGLAKQASRRPAAGRSLLGGERISPPKVTKTATMLLWSLFGIVLVIAAIYIRWPKVMVAIADAITKRQPADTAVNALPQSKEMADLSMDKPINPTEESAELPSAIIDATVPGAAFVPQVGYRYKVFIDDESDDGSSGIARIGGRVTFIPGARSGQTALVDVTRVRDRLVDAVLVRVLDQLDLPPKPLRVAFVPPPGDPVVEGAELDVVISEASSKNPETEGVARIGGLVVVVKSATVIGERVNVRITDRHERIAFAEPTGKPAGTDPLPTYAVAGRAPRAAYIPRADDSAAHVVPGAVIAATIVEPSNRNPDMEGVAKIAGLVVFVKGATTIGQSVNIRIVERRERNAFGEVTSEAPTAPAPVVAPVVPVIAPAAPGVP